MHHLSRPSPCRTQIDLKRPFSHTEGLASKPNLDERKGSPRFLRPVDHFEMLSPLHLYKQLQAYLFCLLPRTRSKSQSVPDLLHTRLLSFLASCWLDVSFPYLYHACIACVILQEGRGLPKQCLLEPSQVIRPTSPVWLPLASNRLGPLWYDSKHFLLLPLGPPNSNARCGPL
jgi:hypothetical protein